MMNGGNMDSQRVVTEGIVENNERSITEVTLENVAEISRKLPLPARIGLKALTRLGNGALTLQLPNGSTYRFTAPEAGPQAELILNNWRLPRRALMSGTIGVAESYMDGDWDSPDVTSFLSLFVTNNAIGEEVSTPNWFHNVAEKVRHWLNENTHRGSKRNIAAHYDLGNAFYRKWLDSTMTYSSAIFERGANSLSSAQTQKYRSLVENGDMQPGHHVLEIGCGWGGFAEYAARHGCQVTGLTISQEQYDFARERMFRQGLNEKVEIKFQDYRDETGTYDRIASIEMFEAVGEKYWSTYFERVRDCLKKGGQAGLQIITIADRNFEYYKTHPDFIQRYIFPGGMLPSPSILEGLTKDAGLGQVAEKIFAHDYAKTLSLWRERFLGAWHDIRPLGFDDRFKRMWEFYLHYCEAGFLSGHIDVRQIFYRRA